MGVEGAAEGAVEGPLAAEGPLAVEGPLVVTVVVLNPTLHPSLTT